MFRSTTWDCDAGQLAEKLLSEQHLNLQKLPIDSVSRRQLQEGYAVLQVLSVTFQLVCTKTFFFVPVDGR